MCDIILSFVKKRETHCGSRPIEACVVNVGAFTKTGFFYTHFFIVPPVH